MKILIAEDDSDIRETYVKLLSKQGHEVISTKDGLECLTIYRKELSSLKDNSQDRTPFDVTIIDFKMPFVNGASVVKTIYEICPKQRIIFATAHTDELLTEIIPSHIEIEVLQKPFSYSDLNNLLERDGIKNLH